MLGVEPVAFTTWAMLLGITLTKFLLVEAYKHLRGRKLAERIYRGPSPAEEWAGRHEKDVTVEARTAERVEQARYAEHAELAEHAERAKYAKQAERAEQVTHGSGPSLDRHSTDGDGPERGERGAERQAGEAQERRRKG